MSGTVFFKVAWDAIGSHLPTDYTSTFEPEAGLPPVKSMLAQTQGGATCAVNARRWCVNYLYAALKRIEELEAMACLGGDEASQRRVKKLEDDLSATRGLLESRGRDMDAIMTALADVQSKGSILDRINYLLNKNRELAKVQVATTKDVDNLLATAQLETEITRLNAEVTDLQEQLKRLQTANKLTIDTLDPILLAAANRLYPGGVPKGTSIGAPEVVKLITEPQGGAEELATLRDALFKAKRNGQVYYSGWNRSKNTKPVTDYEKLAVALSSALQRGVEVPLEGTGGLATPDQLVDAAVALLGGLSAQVEVIPEQEQPDVNEPALDPKVTIQALETELVQLKDQMLADEHANLELQNKLTSVANSRDSLSRELTAAWDLLPDELQGMRTSFPGAIASLLRIWTAHEDKVKELTNKVTLNVERRHILLAYLTKLFPSTIMHKPEGPDYPWNLQFTTPHGTFAARVSDKHFELFTHVPKVSEQEIATVGLYNAMKEAYPITARLKTRDQEQEQEDQLAHLQDTIKDLTAELEARPKAPNRGGTVRVGDHALMCHAYHVDGKVGQLPSTMTFVSDEQEEALSLGNFTGIPAPLQARYIREDVALEMAQEEKPPIAAAEPTGPVSPQDQIAQTVTEMVCNLLDTEHPHQPKGRLILEWQPDKSRPCGKSYDDYESGVITLVSSITPALAATPQEGTNLALDVHHLTVLLAWEGDHPATWKEGVAPLIVNKTI